LVHFLGYFFLERERSNIKSKPRCAKLYARP
jgi:hypothetical protein